MKPNPAMDSTLQSSGMLSKGFNAPITTSVHDEENIGRLKIKGIRTAM